MGKTFEYESTVTIGDTNLLQNVYYTHLFRLHGIVRELWVKDAVPEGLETLQSGTIIMTKSAACNFKRDLYLYDRVLTTFQIGKIREASVELLLKNYRKETMELCAEGEQTVVFAGLDHKIVRVPENFRKAAEEYLVVNGAGVHQ